MNYPICKMGKITDLGGLNELSIQRQTQSNTLGVKNEALNTNSLSLLLLLFLKFLRVDWARVVHAEGLSDKCRQTRVRVGVAFFFLIFICLAAPGLRCSTWDLLPLACELSCHMQTRMWGLVPGPEMEPGPQIGSMKSLLVDYQGSPRAGVFLRASSLTWWYLS